MNTVHPQIYYEQSDKYNSTPAQTDSGKIISNTATIDILNNFKQMLHFPVGHSTIVQPMYLCGKSDFSMTKNKGETIFIPMYYSPSASGSIISPDNIC